MLGMDVSERKGFVGVSTVHLRNARTAVSQIYERNGMLAHIRTLPFMRELPSYMRRALHALPHPASPHRDAFVCVMQASAAATPSRTRWRTSSRATARSPRRSKTSSRTSGR